MTDFVLFFSFSVYQPKKPNGKASLSHTATAAMTPALQGEPLLRTLLGSGETSQTAVQAENPNPSEKKKLIELRAGLIPWEALS